MERLIDRIRQMLYYGLTREDIILHLCEEYSKEEIFCCYVAAKMLAE